jgi:hypothetical protein
MRMSVRARRLKPVCGRPGNSRATAHERLWSNPMFASNTYDRREFQSRLHTRCMRNHPMTAAQLAEQLNARHSRSGWLARCPAHEDRSPSLSISTRGEKILLHCFAGCTVVAICAALGLRVSDLFNDNAPPVSPAERKARIYLSELRGRLTPRERELASITMIYCDRQSVDFAIARALALAVEGELVQVALEVSE